MELLAHMTKYRKKENVELLSHSLSPSPAPASLCVCVSREAKVTTVGIPTAQFFSFAVKEHKASFSFQIRND